MSRDQLQLKAAQQEAQDASAVDLDAEHNPEVARASSQADLRKQAAQQGVATPGAPLPHMERIQAAFGQHDISGIQAHDDQRSTNAMGAEAYATGNHVVLGGQKDLHTVAHEAAHVVQQRDGVQLKGGVGEKGDKHEQNADAVADRVVAGQSAEDLLGPANNDRAAAGPVQMKDKDDKKAKAHDESSQESYEAASASLKLLATRFHAGAQALKKGLKLEAGPAKEEFLGSIDGHFDRMHSAATHTSAVLSVYNLDQARQSILGSDIAVVVGAFEVWSEQMALADEAAKAANYTKLRGIDWVRNAIDSYAGKIGLTTKITGNRTAPGEDLDTATQAALHEHMEGAIAAVSSAVIDANADSVRARSHLKEILWIARSMKGSLHKKDKQFAKVVTAIRQMEATHPGMKEELEGLLAELERAAT
jgi:hypothetical protein